MMSLFPKVGRVTISQRIVRVKHTRGLNADEKCDRAKAPTTVDSGRQRVGSMYGSLLRWTGGNACNRISVR
jgi:hypothetical protein